MSIAVSRRARNGSGIVASCLVMFPSVALAQGCNRWMRMEPQLRPPPSSDRGMVYDPLIDVSVLFTGIALTGPETWEWDGQAWTRRTQGHFLTAPRVGYGLIFDEERGRPLLFGGRSTSSLPHDDTYLWVHPTGWIDLFTQGDIGGRRSPALAYDSWRHVVVLFGGTGDIGGGSFAYRDTQELVAPHYWLQRATAGPSGGGAMAFDASRGVCVLHGVRDPGETWEWNGSSWSLRDVGGGPSEAAASLVYDSARHVCVLVDEVTTGRLWEWDGQSWQLVEPVGTLPPRRHDQAVAFDCKRQRVVMFGGQNGSFVRDDTWEYGLYPDCDQTTGAGELDIFDFLCFLNKFAAQEPYACDCDISTGQGVCDVFDFMCFQDLFASCP